MNVAGNSLDATLRPDRNSPDTLLIRTANAIGQSSICSLSADR
jgi:hypothetical protein